MKTLDNYFSPYLSAYRASYSTQHVLLHLIEEWKTNLDNNFAVSATLMDLLPTVLRRNFIFFHT